MRINYHRQGNLPLEAVRSLGMSSMSGQWWREEVGLESESGQECLQLPGLSSAEAALDALGEEDGRTKGTSQVPVHA